MPAPEHEERSHVQTKTDKVGKLLTRSQGATLDALCKATGWQAHSVRALLSGLRKAGCQIECSTVEGSGNSTYRITAGPEGSA